MKQVETEFQYVVLDRTRDGSHALVAIREIETTIDHIEESVKCRVIATHLAIVQTIHVLHLIK